MNQEPVELTPEIVHDGPPPGAKRRKRNPVRRLTIAVLVTLVILFLYHIFSDRITPYTSHATVETYLVQIAPRVSGPVIEVKVQDNQTVEQGQPLFRIDPEPFRIALDAANAALERAGQEIGASTASVAAAQARVAERRAELTNARLLAERILPLVERGVFAAARGDRTRADVARAEAAFKNAEAELDRARRDLGPKGADNPQIRAALAAVEKARLDVLYTTVAAPTDGLITNLRLSVGQFAGRGQPVMSFLDARDIWLTADLRENQLGRVKPGNRVEVALDVHPGRIFPGRVKSVGWGVGIGREAATGNLPTTGKEHGWLRPARRFPVRIDFDAEPGGVHSTGIEGVRLGSQADVIVYTKERSILNFVGRLRIRIVSLLSYLY
jgi:multidrug resistance efflux pump